MKKNTFSLTRKFLSRIYTIDTFKLLIELFFAALFLACTIEVIKHYDKYVIPHLENLAFIVAANSSVHDIGKDCDKNCIVIAEISESRFRKLYHESSPIDYCQLSKDLILINQTLKPKTLFIDYDLSPITYDLTAENLDLEGVNHVKICQSKLDAVLDSIGSRVHLILLDPTSEKTSSQVLQWANARKSSKIMFTDGLIISNSGLTTTYSANESSVSSVICYSMGCQNQGHINHHSEADKNHEENVRRINFKAFSKNVKILAIEDITSSNSNSTNGVVMVGGRYGKDDKFTTPLGELYGIDLHAASYVSQEQRVSTFHKLTVLILDIAIGIMVGFFAKLSWEYLLNDHSELVKRKLFPLFMLIIMFLFMMACIWLSLKISNFLMGQWSVWLNPAPIVIGMVIHAFVMTPGEMPGEIIGGHINHHSEHLNGISQKYNLKSFFKETCEWLKPLHMAIPIFGLILYGLILYFD